MRQELRYEGAGEKLYLDLFKNGSRLTPSEVTVKIYDRATLLESLTAIIPETDDPVYCSPGTDITETLYEGLRAVWEVTHDGKTRPYSQLFDVVRIPLVPTLTDDDLINECAALRDNELVIYGEAQGGSLSTLIDPSIHSPSNYWAGGTCEILDGDNVLEIRPVSSFDSLSNTITLGTPFSTAISEGVKYRLRKSYNNEIDQAWKELVSYIRQKGFRPALIVDPEILELPHLYLSLTKICMALASTENDIWWKRSELYREAHQGALSGLQFDYDLDDDLAQDTKETLQVRFRR